MVVRVVFSASVAEGWRGGDAFLARFAPVCIARLRLGPRASVRDRLFPHRRADQIIRARWELQNDRHLAQRRRPRESFRIVGEDEAGPSRGTVSYMSPLARAVLTHGPGETAKIAGSVAVTLHVRLESVQVSPIIQG